MIPCVILASTPKANASPADVAALKKDYFDFVKGPIRSEPMKVRLCDPGDQDGGNGTGREPGGGTLLPEIATLGKTFYDFTTHPAGDRDTQYPKMLRFELCLPFGDIGQALHYIQSEGPGQRLDKVFTYVQIVALSATAFTATSGKSQYL
ncbi:MAG TPA: hypothetical protein VFK48_18295 [Usitatibacter sp.]|nr:hypothetical protein [Usitatibacter sp.]